MHYTLYTIHYTLYTIHYTLYTTHYTLYTIHYTLHIIHYTLYTIYYTLYIHYTLYTVHYTLYTIQKYENVLQVSFLTYFLSCLFIVNSYYLPLLSSASQVLTPLLLTDYVHVTVLALKGYYFHYRTGFKTVPICIKSYWKVCCEVFYAVTI